ncbi:hypothetical protein [Streptomyces tailanensis]|uniref:hypothetical protein n=1 Tax=Streptomyces tailanensis TaxID=2569858 RepID=UPI00155B2522|nr:hypothetical protein [Streptomyces tailanensis]
MTVAVKRTKKRTTDPAADAMRAADAAVAGLKEALDRVGIKLPSLWAGQPVNGKAFVELGGCGAGVATKLAEVVNAAADALPELRTSTR